MRSGRQFQFTVHIHFGHDRSASIHLAVYSGFIRHHSQVYPLINGGKSEGRFHQVIKAHSVCHTHVVATIVVAIHAPAFAFVIVRIIIRKGRDQIEEAFYILQLYPKLNSKRLLANFTECGILRMSAKVNISAILSAYFQLCRNQ